MANEAIIARIVSDIARLDAAHYLRRVKPQRIAHAEKPTATEGDDGRVTIGLGGLSERIDIAAGEAVVQDGVDSFLRSVWKKDAQSFSAIEIVEIKKEAAESLNESLDAMRASILRLTAVISVHSLSDALGHPLAAMSASVQTLADGVAKWTKAEETVTPKLEKK